MSRTNLCLSPYGHAGAGRNFLVFGSFSALKPSLSHPIPRGFASGISGGFGHLLAFGGVFQKFLSWIDRCHRRSLLDFPSLLDTIEARTKSGNRLVIPLSLVQATRKIARGWKAASRSRAKVSINCASPHIGAPKNYVSSSSQAQRTEMDCKCAKGSVSPS